MVKTKILGIIFIALLISCAQQTSPTGGPKDEDPPILIQSTPEKNQLNYKAQSLILEFDEAIVVTSPKEQLIITPDIGPNYEIVAKKNKVILTMEDPLTENTTYAFNFGQAVQDITEKNPAENLSIAFSTGPVIDSLSIAGSVYDLLKGNPLEKIVVAIYQNSDTFDIFKHKPLYITRTQKDGSFVIGNLKEGVYNIYAFNDKNRNLIVDSRSELYGFLAEPIHLENNVNSLCIPVSPMDVTELKVTRARAFNNYYTINLSKKIVDYSITTEDTTQLVVSTFGESRDNIITYNTQPELDSIAIRFKAIDSIGLSLDTIFFIKYSQRDVTPEKLSVTNQSTYIYTDRGVIESTFTTNKPISTLNFDSLFIYLDSTSQIPFTSENLTIDQKNKTLSLAKEFDKSILNKPPPENQPTETTQIIANKKGEPLTLEERANLELTQKKSSQKKNFFYQGKGAFISIDNDSSKSSTSDIKLVKTEDLSLIIINITTEKDFIVNLVNKDFQVVQSEKNNKTVRFQNIIPGDYQIQLIIDVNKNGKWNAGNIFEKREPEPILFYTNEKDSQLIPAKANWEIGPLLITY